ncbi:MAG: DUF1841 family protein [Methylophilaceae bacterium]
MFNPTRDQVRQFFFETWRKYRQNEALTGLEGMALQVMLAHPEYHAILNAPEQFMEQEYFPEMGETNPFLHMSLHLSVLEQLSIDQPTGIVAAYQALQIKHGDDQAAQHQLMDCLAETVWRAQRGGTAPDSAAYLACMQNSAKQ